MAVMADHCPGLDVHVIDQDPHLIDRWNGLNEKAAFTDDLVFQDVLQRVHGRNLTFSTDISTHISHADMVFISVDVPTKQHGQGAGLAYDLTLLQQAARLITDYATGSTIVVECTTLAVRSAECLLKILGYPNQTQYKLLSNPAFPIQGSLIKNLQDPERVLVGGQCSSAIKELIAIYEAWVDKDKIITTNLWSAELARMAGHAFLAQRLTSINSIASVCEATGADVQEVRCAIGADQRIGPNFLLPCLGLGNGTLTNELHTLIYLADYLGLDQVATYWRSVLSLNQWSRTRIADLICRSLFGALREKRVAILGFPLIGVHDFDHHNSAMSLCRDLLRDGAALKIFSPGHPSRTTHHHDREKSAWDGLHDEDMAGTISVVAELSEACTSVDVILILHGWSDDHRPCWHTLCTHSNRPCWIFDTTGQADLGNIAGSGIDVWQIGNGGLYS